MARESIVRVLYIATAAWVFTMWVWGADSPATAINGDPRSLLGDMIYGKAHNPFVQRALVPLLVRGIHGVVPSGILENLEHGLRSVPKVEKEIARLGWDPEYLSEYLLAFGFAALALLGLPYVLREFAVRLWNVHAEVINVIPLAGILGLPLFFHSGTHYIYDFPALFLFAASLVLLLDGTWKYYYPTFILACLNKETAVLLIVAFVLVWYRHIPRSRLFAHVGWMTLLFALVKGTLMGIYGGNEGPTLEFHLWANIHHLLLPYTAHTLLVMLLIAGSVVYKFRTKHPVLQALTWIVLIQWGLYLVFGTPTEFRFLYEVYPIVLFLSLHTILFDWGGIAFQHQTFPQTQNKAR